MDNRLQTVARIAETAIPGKKAVWGSLTLRDYDGQVAEALAPVMSAEQNDESR